MNINIQHTCPEYPSCRAACVRSLYNVDTPAFSLQAELPLEAEPWQVGLIVGPSGSGKSSLGQRLWGPDAVYNGGAWPLDAPIVDAIAPGGKWEDVTTALSAVGLGNVPAWLRPYSVLSTGEKFRADLARIISEAPARVVVDEFTSVVDRQIAQVGAAAFAKAWRGTEGQAVLLSCHYDIVDWLAPDWVFDTATGHFEWTRGRLRRPEIRMDIYQTDWRYWPYFAPHHYLNPPNAVAAFCYVAFVGDKPVAHIAMTTRPGLVEARTCRYVILPEWQGIGVGLAFLHAVCDLWRAGKNKYGLPMRSLVNTSHPGLAGALRRHPKWRQIGAKLYGEDKAASRRALAQTARRDGWKNKAPAGYGGHFRAVQSFRYFGDEKIEETPRKAEGKTQKTRQKTK